MVYPLTPLEVWLRREGGAGYQGGFIEHYLVPLIYPAGWTPALGLALGVFVPLVNAVAYALYVRRRPTALR